MTATIIFLAVVCIVAAIYVFLIAPSHDTDKISRELMVPYAHRGLHSRGIPENSMSAFIEAASRGYGIELDIQLSRDGKVVVFHDSSLYRMCKLNKKVSDLTYAELSELRLGDSDEQIPLFSEVLERIAGIVPLLIEFKGVDADTSLCEKAFTLLDSYTGPFCVESFNPMIIRYIRQHRPEFIRGQLITILSKNDFEGPAIIRFMLSHMLLNVLSRPHFIAYDLHKKPSFGIRIASSILGAKKFAWTIRSVPDYLALKEERIVSIFENFDPQSKQ